MKKFEGTPAKVSELVGRINDLLKEYAHQVETRALIEVYAAHIIRRGEPGASNRALKFTMEIIADEIAQKTARERNAA